MPDLISTTAFSDGTAPEAAHDLFGAINRPGFRLHRLEMFNWGTFDSAGERTLGHVYRVDPAGGTTLLIGRNGSGKSTLVDALLTLLVRPQVRNYNVAAGARKRERDERTYVKGAFERRSREDDNRADVQFLRPHGTHYSVLLACFRNARKGRAFTLAVVLYLAVDGRCRKVYCFSTDERTIAGDFGGFYSMDKLTRQLRERGFQTTEHYTEYYEWFRKATGVQPKAMDTFNQTVAVKDIERLNDFIRDHMLEPSLREDDINSLLTHYDQLHQAHQCLVRVREQERLLLPIEESGLEWKRQSSRLNDVQRMVDASEAYFRRKTIDLYEPECRRRREELDRVVESKQELKASIEAAQEEARRLRTQIEGAGGDRLRMIPHEIANHETAASAKRRDSLRYHQLLRTVGLTEAVSNQQQLEDVQRRLVPYQREVQKRLEDARKRHEALVVERGDVRRIRNESQDEWALLEGRRENLPPGHSELRRNLCAELGLAVDDLRFAGELMRVTPEESAWEASIEIVLRTLALSLLVPDRNYELVSSYIDRNRLAGRRGEGLRLDYLRVGPVSRTGSVPAHDSIIRKLQFRNGHPLLPWLKAELQQRFDFHCCETIEDFQLAAGLAVTRERHVKRGRTRHTKDDRELASNPRNFVLGWDNREKRRRLAEEIARCDARIAALGGPIAILETERTHREAQLAAINELDQFRSFADMDFASHERAITDLELERKRIEEGSDQIRALRARLSACEASEDGLQAQRDDAVGRERELRNEIEGAETLVANARRSLEELNSAGMLESVQSQFSRLDAHFAESPLTFEDLFERSAEFERSQRARLAGIRDQLKPLESAIAGAMTAFVRKFQAESADLAATVEYLDSYLSLLTAIREEDLPRHEARFKEHLNDKVTREIGQLSGQLQLERTSIEDRIELLNDALRQLEYRPGTYMRLEARLVRDREIIDFQQALANCLSDAFEGSFEADEARFERIRDLIMRLREEDRWRNKVTDVRRWFDFVAREIDNHSGEERGYYEDSTGQSGGEKAKLAFTILVAAVAYQYCIDPQREDSDRFHFVVVDEMFSKVDDQYSEYALRLFERFGLQLLIVAPLDAKARVTDGHVQCYLLVTKDETSRSSIHTMTAREFEDQVDDGGSADDSPAEFARRRPPKRPR